MHARPVRYQLSYASPYGLIENGLLENTELYYNALGRCIHQQYSLSNHFSDLIVNLNSTYEVENYNQNILYTWSD